MRKCKVIPESKKYGRRKAKGAVLGAVGERMFDHSFILQ